MNEDGASNRNSVWIHIERTLLGILTALGVLLITSCSLLQPTIQESIPDPLATPITTQPAAGICEKQAGKEVQLTIHDAIPSPRCLRVEGDQTLRITNETASYMEYTLGNQYGGVNPQGFTQISSPFREYLAPGVHYLEISACCNVEIWLEGGS